MNAVKLSLVLMLLVSAMAIAKPRVKDVSIEPALTSPGDKINITIEFKGKVRDIKYVEMISRDREPSDPIHLKQDTKKPHVWSVEYDIPKDAARGHHELELKVTDRFGNEIVNRKYRRQIHGKAGLVKFEIL